MTTIMTRTPLRVSFVGGGSDLPSFYSISGGAVVSSTINYWIDIVVRDSPPALGGSYKINCLGTHQETTDPDHIQNTIVREVIKFLNVPPPLEISSFSDIPPGTGLGSSSSFTVGLLNALHCFRANQTTWQQLAEEAYHIEVEVLKMPIGKQDQYIAAFGGPAHLSFNANHTVTAENIICRPEVLRTLENNFMLFYVGSPRKAGSILSSISGKDQKQQQLLKSLCGFCDELKSVISEGSNLHRVGAILDEGWQLKRRLSDSISNPQIEEIYNKAKTNGAMGGKLLGAGGGGFFLLYAEEVHQKKIRQSLSHLPEIPFHFSSRGSHIVTHTS